MLLEVRDRILLGNILPAEGDVRTMKTIQTLRNDLLFSEDEVKKFKIKTDDNRVTWDATVDSEVEIQVGELATEVIVAALKKLDESEKVTVELLPLYEKFIKA